MKIKNTLFTFMFILLQISVFAQQGRTIKGTIKDAETNEALPGVSVLVVGTATGTTTDVNGQYSVTVEGEGKKIIFSFVGYANQTVDADKEVIDILLAPTATTLNETVVTALGVSREKKSLGYATQEISGDKLTGVKSGNFVNQMSGKVAGVRVKNSSNMGGSTNIIVRGSSSILGDNQALFVVDGVPMNNEATNDRNIRGGGTNVKNQASGQGGFDYGSPISDLNPEDIESVNVLKGAAATALYGSRAARGVILITTKRGKLATADTKRRFGVTVNSNLTLGMIDKSTFPTYQQEYGGGYTFALSSIDINGDGIKELVVPMGHDASLGAKFDPNLMVYQWQSFVPDFKGTGPTAWVAAGENGPISFFKKSMSATNGFAIDGGNEKGAFRVSYSNSNESGILPNSNLKKNNFGFNGGMEINDKFSASIGANFTNAKAIGRNETGYNDNTMSSFRQWMQTNVNFNDLKEVYDKTGFNYSWNMASYKTPLKSAFWDNPYFQRNESFQSDERDRFFGNMGLNYKVSDAIGLLARIGVDQYATLQEERLAVGSYPERFGINGVSSASGYGRLDKTFREVNLDFMANFKKDLNENINLTALLGANFRRTTSNTIYASTNGGLLVPKLYSITNSISNPLPSVETLQLLGVNGYFGSISLGYRRFLFLDVTARQDYSSTLPADNNAFFYPGVSGSFVFSEKMTNVKWLDFGKVRLNYANVGNDAPFASLTDVYNKPSNFGNISLFTLPLTKNNPGLKPEISSSLEGGLEMVFFKKRLGFDFAVYNTITKNQILQVAVSTATGYTAKFVNAGKVQNKGIELNLYGTPLKTKDFSWQINVNFSKNTSEVIELFEGVNNLQIINFQGGVTLNATVGEAYGTLKGSEFEYKNGQKVIGADGYYKITTAADKTIGNINPDFIAGITNTLTYKNWSYSFLIDMQQGGSIWSVDLWYGLGSGLYPESVGLNDKGNPVRNSIADGGGVILDGVKEDGTKNDIRVEVNTSSPFAYEHSPNAGNIYDASYVKLREMSLSYRIPLKKEYFFTNASVAVVGSNLWIIHKNLPYADPEAGVGSGNIQGFQIGVMPTVRTFGFNLTLQF